MKESTEKMTLDAQSVEVTDGVREYVRRTVALAMTKLVPKVATDVADERISQRDLQRQRLEDERANRRNFNRMMMLLGALVIGLAITWILNGGYLGPWGKVLAPYSFCITILLDSSLTIYAYVKRY